MTGEYELVVVSRGDRDADANKKQVDEIKKEIENDKGVIESVEDWGSKELAYPIKKQTHGFYTLITFRSGPQTPGKLNSKMRLMEDLLRYLVVRKENKERKKAKGKGKKSKTAS